VALGARAVRYFSNAPYPYIASLVSARSYREIFGDAGALLRRPLLTLLIDQPLERQLALIGALLPRVAKLGCLVSEDYELAAPTTPLQLVVRRIAPTSNVVLELGTLLREVDAVLAVPDNAVFNRKTLHGVLLSAYRQGKPVIGYSRPLVEAGALLAAYTPPELLGEETAALVRRVIDQSPDAPQLVYPRQFRIAVNRGIARVLGIGSLPEDIEQRIFTSVEEVR